jgi:hypothetical protein
VTELRHFPPSWKADDDGACFVVKDRNGQARLIAMRFVLSGAAVCVLTAGSIPPPVFAPAVMFPQVRRCYLALAIRSPHLAGRCARAFKLVCSP